MRTFTPADEAYLPALLSRLTPEERAALDRFAARALDNPEATPGDDDERQAVGRADLLARRGGGMGGYARPKPQGAV